MAGDWIKMRNDLSEDPAVIGMASALGLDEFAVVGRLHCLWAWADSQSRDGHAAGVTGSWIDRKVQRDGFAKAMCDVSWLAFNESGVIFPKFENHNGNTGKTRAMGAQRKQNQRSRDAIVTEEVTSKSRTRRDKNVTREEKRREEEIQAFVLPDWIPSDTWSSYCKVRAGKRAKNEPHALGLIVADLESFKDAGYDPVEILNTSIKSGWAGVFEPKGGQKVISMQSAVDASRRAG